MARLLRTTTKGAFGPICARIPDIPCKVPANREIGLQRRVRSGLPPPAVSHRRTGPAASRGFGIDQCRLVSLWPRPAAPSGRRHATGTSTCRRSGRPSRRGAIGRAASATGSRCELDLYETLQISGGHEIGIRIGIGRVAHATSAVPNPRKRAAVPRIIPDADVGRSSCAKLPRPAVIGLISAIRWIEGFVELRACSNVALRRAAQDG